MTTSLAAAAAAHNNRRSSARECARTASDCSRIIRRSLSLSLVRIHSRVARACAQTTRPPNDHITWADGGRRGAYSYNYYIVRRSQLGNWRAEVAAYGMTFVASECVGRCVCVCARIVCI